ncbi:MAG: hypothetical protein LBJ48_00570 [Coriobacteriales bacterium]|jgi:hypothetical protein|nr:hypothetical protein [Coriobacteriales bacterium]
MKKTLMVVLALVVIFSLCYGAVNRDLIWANSDELEAGAASEEAGAATGEAAVSEGDAEPRAQGTVGQEGESPGAQESAPLPDTALEQDAYWIVDPLYAELIGEYEAAVRESAKTLGDTTVILDATLLIQSLEGGIESVITSGGRKVVSNGTNAPDYDDQAGTHLTSREGLPQAGTSSDRSLLRLVETHKGTEVYEATFFFGSEKWPEVPFTAFKTFVVLEADAGSVPADSTSAEKPETDTGEAAGSDGTAGDEGTEAGESSDPAEPGGETEEGTDTDILEKPKPEVPGHDLMVTPAMANLYSALSINLMSSWDVYTGYQFTTYLTWAGNWNGSMDNGRFDGELWWEDNYLSIVLWCQNPGRWGPESISYAGAVAYGTVISVDRANQYVYVDFEVPAPAGYMQSLISSTVRVSWSFTGSLDLIKSSANPGATNGDSYYDLAGAQYGLYRTWADADADVNRVHTFTTNSAGNSNRATGLTPGYYALKEVTAPKGYALDPTSYGVSVGSTLTTTYHADIPLGDIALFKLSGNPGVTNGNPYYSLAGAEYGLYVSEADALLNVNRLHTFTTDSAGNTNRAAGLYYGNYFIKETKAPRGYAVDPTVYSVLLNSSVALCYCADVPLGDITLVKSSANPSVTEGNLCYDLAGAEYGLYRSWGDANAGLSPIHTFVTDSAGKTDKATALSLGTYYVKELKAPKGYELDPTITQVVLNSSLATTLRKDEPLNDPALLLVQKLDSVTGEAYGTDDPDGLLLANAEFTVRYWDGYYDTLKEAEASGKPTRTWVFGTELTGRAILSSILLVSGSDPLYYHSSGTPIIPLGTVAIQETKPPPGYLLPDPNPISLQQIKVTGNLLDPVTRLNAFILKEDPHEVTAEKLDSDTEVPVANTEFTLYKESRPGKGDWTEVSRHITDDYGKCVFSPVAVGSYRLDETRPNPLYAETEESADGPHYFEITPDTTGEVQVFKNDLIQVSVDVYKKTIALTGSALDGTKDNAGSNVGSEEYYYRFGARSTSNVRVDEFTITDSLEYVTSKGYRMTTLWTGTAPEGMDYDSLMHILYKTNLTDSEEPVAFTYSPLSANPPNANNPERKMSVSLEPGWRVWQECVSTTRALRLDVADLTLEEGEYLTGLRAVYGGVVKGFYTGVGWEDGESSESSEPETIPGIVQLLDINADDTDAFELRDWAYAVIATEGLLPIDEMGDETVIEGSITADLSRNWGGEAPVLSDVATDATETRVVATFTHPREDLGINPGSFFASFARGFGLPITGDTVWLQGLGLAILVAAGVMLVVVAVKRRSNAKEAGERDDEHDA